MNTENPIGDRPDETPMAQPAPPDAHGSDGGSSRRGWLVLAAGAAAVVAAIVLGIILLRPSGEPAADPVATPSFAASASASVEASPGPSVSTPPSPPASTEPTLAAIPADGWEQVATFTEVGTTRLVEDVASWSGGFIAVGTRYEAEAFGNFGPPPPHSGVVWLTSDGHEWEETAPAAEFDEVELEHLLVVGDRLIVIGSTVDAEFDRDSVAWASADGRAWEPFALNGLASGAHVVAVESGGRGSVAAVLTDPEPETGVSSELWHSADGGTWSRTREVEGGGVYDVGAGDEGFVAVLQQPVSDAVLPVVIASSDGVEWIESQSDAGSLVAPVAGDWFSIGAPPSEAAPIDGVPTAAWQSANGLDWERIGDFTTGTFAPDPDTSCVEYPADLLSIGRTLLAATTLAYPCSEGQVVLAGSGWTSVDGATWELLPFGPHAYMGGAAERDGVAVTAVDARTSHLVDLDVRFWVAGD